jgi:hypothetical protein
LRFRAADSMLGASPSQDPPMIRTLAGIALGVVVASTVVYAVDMLGHSFYPLPPDLNYDDVDAVRRFVNGQSIGAMAFVLAAFLAGGFAGSFAAGWMTGPGHPFATMVPALLVAVGVLAMHRMAPHPL